MRWLIIATALMLLAALLSLGLLVYAMYVLLGLLLVSRYLAREWTENLEATRASGSDRFQIGDSTTVRVQIRNSGRWSIPWLLLEDSVPRDAITQQPPRIRLSQNPLAVAHLRGKAESILQYEVHFLMRGYFQLGPLLIESGDLFGLHRRYRVVTEPRFVTVLPRMVPLRGYDIAARRTLGEIRLTHRLFEDPTRISGVRPYQPGDALHRIHWRASAHTGQLQSKVYEPSAMSGATLLLDFHRESFRGPGEVVRAELAVTTAASLANAVNLLGQRIGLVTNGRDAADRVREEGWNQEFTTRSTARQRVKMVERSDRLRPIVIETRRGPDQFLRVHETLARVELTDGLDFAGLLAETSSHIPRSSAIIAILGNVTSESAVLLGNLRRHGYSVTAVVVVFDEPDTTDWAQRPDWMSWLIAEGVRMRRVESEAELADLCSEGLARNN